MKFPAVSGGNIAPSRFVTPSAVADNTVLQATTGSHPIGVSQAGTRNTPYSTLDDGFAAIATENIHVFGENETCGLEIGSGGCAAGDFLKPDVNGAGVKSSTDGDWYGAISGQAAVQGQIVEVEILIGQRGSSA